MQALDVVAADLFCGMKAGLGVIAVGKQKILRVLVSRIELLLGDRRDLRVADLRLPSLLDLLCAGRRRQERKASDRGKTCRKPFRVLHDFPLGFLLIAVMKRRWASSQ